MKTNLAIENLAAHTLLVRKTVLLGIKILKSNLFITLQL